MEAPGETYDHNFCFALPESLESERLLLTPFIPSIHAELFVSKALLSPEIFTYLPFGPYRDTDHFVTELVHDLFQKDSGFALFAIYDKTKLQSPDAHPSDAGAFAGVVGLVRSSASQLQTEIGAIMILPDFQGSHVASNAVGLLLHYALDLPSTPGEVDKQPSLGLRRVVWKANTLNKASIRLAERMGFRMEGVIRWDKVLPSHKEVGNGRPLRQRDPRADCIGRDTALLSLCWDDWEDGATEKVDAIMARRK